MEDRDPDAQAMRRMRVGDSAALEELYDRHTPRLFSLALRILGRASDAEDAVQDAWVQVWKSAASWDPARGSVGAWLATITRTRALDRLRSRTSRERIEAPGSAAADPPAPGTPAAEVVQRQLAAHVGSALAALTPSQRQVIELAYFGGLSQSQIAERLGTPLGTVKSWTRQALSRLRERVPEEAWS